MRHILSLKVVYLLIVTLISVLLVGCGGKETEVTPQKFIWDYEARIAESRQRIPEKTEERIIPAGNMFPVRTMSRLSSATSQVGDKLSIQVVQDVIIDGAVVIPVGSTGSGRVTEAESARGWGKSGTLQISLQNIRTYDNQIIPIEANERTAARDQSVIGAGTVVGVVLLGPLYLFAPALSRGDDIVIPADSQFYVMVTSPVTVNARVYLTPEL